MDELILQGHLIVPPCQEHSGHDSDSAGWMAINHGEGPLVPVQVPGTPRLRKKCMCKPKVEEDKVPPVPGQGSADVPHESADVHQAAADAESKAGTEAEQANVPKDHADVAAAAADAESKAGAAQDNVPKESADVAAADAKSTKGAQAARADVPKDSADVGRAAALVRLIQLDQAEREKRDWLVLSKVFQAWRMASYAINWYKAHWQLEMMTAHCSAEQLEMMTAHCSADVPHESADGHQAVAEDAESKVGDAAVQADVPKKSADVAVADDESKAGTAAAQADVPKKSAEVAAAVADAESKAGPAAAQADVPKKSADVAVADAESKAGAAAAQADVPKKSAEVAAADAKSMAGAEAMEIEVVCRSSFEAQLSPRTSGTGSQSSHQSSHQSQALCKTGWFQQVDGSVFHLDFWVEMMAMCEGDYRLNGDPMVQLCWLVFGYQPALQEFEGLTSEHQGWPHNCQGSWQQAQRMIPAMNKLVGYTENHNAGGPRATDIDIARGMRRVIQHLAGGHVPPPVHIAHACMLRRPFKMQQSWAVPQYVENEDILQVGFDVLKACRTFLERLELLEKEKPAAPTFDQVALFQALRRSTQENNWALIMQDPAARSAFYDALHTHVPPTIEIIPCKMDVGLDGFTAFWGMETFMKNNNFSWQTNVDVAMLPMDVQRPKGAECPRNTATDVKKERERERQRVRESL